jgi:hypothetical protein
MATANPAEMREIVEMGLGDRGRVWGFEACSGMCPCAPAVAGKGAPHGETPGQTASCRQSFLPPPPAQFQQRPGPRHRANAPPLSPAHLCGQRHHHGVVQSHRRHHAGRVGERHARRRHLEAGPQRSVHRVACGAGGGAAGEGEATMGGSARGSAAVRAQQVSESGLGQHALRRAGARRPGGVPAPGAHAEHAGVPSGLGVPTGKWQQREDRVVAHLRSSRGQEAGWAHAATPRSGPRGAACSAGGVPPLVPTPQHHPGNGATQNCAQRGPFMSRTAALLPASTRPRLACHTQMHRNTGPSPRSALVSSTSVRDTCRRERQESRCRRASR